MTTTCPAHLIQFNLFRFHLTHRGHDPLDMELVNTEIRLQISYMKQTHYNYFKVHPNRRHSIYKKTTEKLYKLWCIIQYLNSMTKYNETVIQYKYKILKITRH